MKKGAEEELDNIRADVKTAEKTLDVVNADVTRLKKPSIQLMMM